ncbi:hypothetical protein BDV36DRAFT_97975 [Aspergillus pseudocaelatus]|uniref:Uncharacterized protein n=1 Tax=Aspergillus pseudocaelatus TaxID=1825620 RepID=A0ABQ6W711_9EURO|nr:hypothetical protein BDV36DRAFT_97975 [Aspergillus pseudocaelatus]
MIQIDRHADRAKSNVLLERIKDGCSRGKQIKRLHPLSDVAFRVGDWLLWRRQVDDDRIEVSMTNVSRKCFFLSFLYLVLFITL